METFFSDIHIRHKNTRYPSMKHLGHKLFNYSVNQYWQGGIQKGKTILLCANNNTMGMGDEIISVRFMKQLRDLGMFPIWLTNTPQLRELFNRNGFKTVNEFKKIQSNWLWTYAMHLAVYLDVNEDDLWYGTYLKSSNKADLLPGKKKIGIKTMGSPEADRTGGRSIPFNELINCIPEDYEIYSFHVDEDLYHPRVTNLKGKIKTWDDTFDYLNQMDVVVSSCTSLIHAAGAMGKKSYALVPMLNFFVWAKNVYHSKWYDNSLTILRKKEENNWNAPLNELRELLCQQ